MGKIALLMIDVQKGVRQGLGPDMQRKFDEVIQYMNATSSLFRQVGLPVVVVQDLSLGDPDSESFACVNELVIHQEDRVIHKTHNNAFWKTELEDVLKERDVDAVVLSGFAAEYCVLFSYNGAKERGFTASILQHGVAGVTLEGIRSIETLRPVVSYEALAYMVGRV